MPALTIGIAQQQYSRDFMVWRDEERSGYEGCVTIVDIYGIIFNVTAIPYIVMQPAPTSKVVCDLSHFIQGSCLHTPTSMRLFTALAFTILSLSSLAVAIPSNTQAVLPDNGVIEKPRWKYSVCGMS